MACLSRYLGLIVGDLVPKENAYWRLYCVLRKIIGIVSSPRIVKSEIYMLKDLIYEHNSQYLSLFGDLKPKMLLMTHCPRLILKNGPLVHYWGMKVFERKNRQMKII